VNGRDSVTSAGFKPMTSVSHITHKIFLLEISKTSHVEVGMNTSTITLRVIGGYEKVTQCLEV
jgi:hypothetical protein